MSACMKFTKRVSGPAMGVGADWTGVCRFGSRFSMPKVRAVWFVDGFTLSAHQAMMLCAFHM